MSIAIEQFIGRLPRGLMSAEEIDHDAGEGPVRYATALLERDGKGNSSPAGPFAGRPRHVDLERQQHL